jgi:hypothetical protein
MIVSRSFIFLADSSDCFSKSFLYLYVLIVINNNCYEHQNNHRIIDVSYWGDAEMPFYSYSIYE